MRRRKLWFQYRGTYQHWLVLDVVVVESRVESSRLCSVRVWRTQREQCTPAKNIHDEGGAGRVALFSGLASIDALGGSGAAECRRCRATFSV
jgi:hypothetical protein